MAKQIYYTRQLRMEPRADTTYSTVYVKQTKQQRKQLTEHIVACIDELALAVETNISWEAVLEKPLQGFKTTKGINRSSLDIIQDLVQESRGLKRNGDLKDYALAPIERWNRLFAHTDYEIDLVKSQEELEDDKEENRYDERF